MASDILVVDDEADIRELVAGLLEDEGYRTRVARNSDEALATIEERRPHLVFLDIWLQGSRLDGLQILEVVKAQHPDLPVVMISGHGNVETAVAARWPAAPSRRRGCGARCATCASAPAMWAA
jgi:two-component system nitrogen regulation response regulator NtrX